MRQTIEGWEVNRQGDRTTAKLALAAIFTITNIK